MKSLVAIFEQAANASLKHIHRAIDGFRAAFTGKLACAGRLYKDVVPPAKFAGIAPTAPKAGATMGLIPT